MNAPVRLNPDQLQHFERDGFLLSSALLSPDENAHYLRIVEKMSEEFRAENNLEAHQTVEIRNAIAREPPLLPLLSHLNALGKELLALADPIQRQLLDASSHEVNFYLPDRAVGDVPLKNAV